MICTRFSTICDARLARAAVALVGFVALATTSLADDKAALRLVPFPKEVRLESGRFDMQRPLVLLILLAHCRRLSWLTEMARGLVLYHVALFCQPGTLAGPGRSPERSRWTAPRLG